MSAPRAPAGLGKDGRALWRSVISDLAPGWRLDAAELALLAHASRTADACAALGEVVEEEGYSAEGSMGQRVVHPAVAELRQQRALLARLLRELRLPDEAAETTRVSRASRYARHAAGARWGNVRQLEEGR